MVFGVGCGAWGGVCGVVREVYAYLYIYIYIYIYSRSNKYSKCSRKSLFYELFSRLLFLLRLD